MCAAKLVDQLPEAKSDALQKYCCCTNIARCDVQDRTGTIHSFVGKYGDLLPVMNFMSLMPKSFASSMSNLSCIAHISKLSLESEQITT